MQEIPKIILKTKKDEAIKRFHPWVFSGAIKKIYGNVWEGCIVEVYSNKDEFLAVGHYSDGSIAVRIFSFDKIIPDESFWKSKVQAAYNLRHLLKLTNSDSTNVYRLIHAEGDGLPGLIVDYYNGTAVIQAHSVGMHKVRMLITEALQQVYGEKLLAVYYKSSETLPKIHEVQDTEGYLYFKEKFEFVTENGSKFKIDWEKGQKTGFFIDQRENRKLLAKYSYGKKVLNTFCYSGSFSVYALFAGANIVHSVDSSKKAIDMTEKNVEINGFSGPKHKSFSQDTLEYLATTEEKYDVIILDPPAYAKHQNVKHNAVQGYKRLNAKALEIIQSGGILFTFSCSQVVDRRLFEATIVAAAIQSKRKVKILHHLSQPADHPVSAFHPEGEYLKGLVLFVE